MTDSVSNIAQAICKVMAGVGFVQKAGKNEFHGYKYATEGDALSALRPHLIENGLVIISDVVECSSPDDHGNTTVKIKYRIIHASGEEIVCHFVGCGNDRAKNGSVGDKGVYKAITGANKYFLLKTFQLETGDDPERDEKSFNDFSAPDIQDKPKPAAQKRERRSPEPPAEDPFVAPAPEASAPALDQSEFLKTIADELEHCSTKDEARQVWRRYTAEIADFKLNHPEMEAQIVSIFATATKALK
jgi:hypothetical protein